MMLSMNIFLHMFCSVDSVCSDNFCVSSVAIQIRAFTVSLTLQQMLTSYTKTYHNDILPKLYILINHNYFLSPSTLRKLSA
jgi:hypothetical protein